MTKEIIEMINTIQQDAKQYFNDVFEKEKILGNLPKNIDVEIISTYVMTILFGMGVLAKNGSTIDELDSVIDIALNNLFPTNMSKTASFV